MKGAVPCVVGIGEVLWDKFPDVDRLGGAPANFAFHARQMGLDATIISRIGTDADGDRLAKLLGSVKLPMALIQHDPVYPTGLVRVEIDEGQPRYTIADPAAWDYLEWNGKLESIASRVDVVCFGTLAQRNAVSRATIQRFVALCRDQSIRLFDINLRQAFYSREEIEFGLRHATVLKLNADELARIAEIFGWEAQTERFVSSLFRSFPVELIALTRGASGCEIHTRNEKITSAAPQVTCVDAVGAGDAFSAALVAGLLQKRPLQEVGDRANKVGAYVASQPGAMPELPLDLKS